MATLFNTKISATYEGLLKTIDNAAITATLKELTDGSGNQSGLYLNTAGDFKVSSVLEWGSLKDTGTGVTITQFVTSTDGIENFNNNTTIPTSAAVKSYVDANGGGLAGSGTTNFVSKWSNASTLANSQLFDNGTNIGIGTVTPSEKLEVVGYVKSTIGFKALNNTTLLEADNNTVLSNTAFYNMLFKTNNAERVRITNGGSVGIGTSSPNAKLTVRGSGLTSQDFFHIEDSGGVRMIEVTSDPVGNANLQVKDTSGSTKNLINSAGNSYFNGGNIGINTTTPSEKLEVVGNILGDGLGIGNSTIYNNSININNTGTFRIGNTELLSKSGVNLSIYQGKITVENGGNIGINTTSPSEKLDIVGTSGNTNIRIYDSSANSEVGLKLQSDATTWTLQNWGSGGDKLRVLNNSGTTIQTWDENGNIGIGTSSPSEKLEVNGNLLVTGTIIGSGGSFLPLAGGIMTGNTVHEDNVKSRYGNNGDLEIYHDGNNSYISDVATGGLFIKGSAFVSTQAANGENMIKAIADGAVELYFNNSKKIATANNGVTIDGNIIGGSVFSLISEFTNRGRIDLSSSTATNANQISFLTNGNVQSVITKEGNFGVGTTSPMQKLDTPNLVIGGPTISSTTRANSTMIDNLNGLARFYSLGPNTTTGGGYQFNSLSSDVTAGAGNVMTILNSGNIGIGTSAPNQKLVVDGNVRISAEKYYFVSGGGAGFGSDASGNFKIRQNDADLIFGSGNNVGIGTSSPSIKLDVAGRIKVSYDGNTSFYGGDFIRLFNSQALRFENSGGTNVAQINLNGNSYFNGGNIGIGTTTPAGTLDINNVETGVFFRRLANPSLQFVKLTTDAASNRIESSVKDFILRTTGATSLRLETNNTTRLTVQSNGNIGLGTNSPSQKLQVNGNVIANIYYVGNTSNYIDVASGLRIRGDSNGINFAPNGSEAMRILGNGNIGIGTSSPISKFSVNEIGTTNAAVSIVTARYGISLQGAGTSNSQYLLNLQSNGGSTDVMRVQSSGNIGIGTSGPSEKLEVEGGDIKIKDASAGLILTSPNGTVYKITVANDGTVTSTAV